MDERLDPASLKAGDEVGYWEDDRMKIGKVDRITPSGRVVIDGKTIYTNKHRLYWYWLGKRTEAILYSPEYARQRGGDRE